MPHAVIIRRLGLAVRALAALSVLMVPVSARAGLETDHPHGLLQLVLDAGDGALDHHLESDFGVHRHGHGRDDDHHHGPARSLQPVFDPVGIGVDVRPEGPPGVFSGSREAGQAPVEGRVGPAVAVAIGSVMALAAAIVAGAPPIAGGRRLWWPVAVNAEGQARPPDVPPPRLVPGLAQTA